MSTARVTGFAAHPLWRPGLSHPAADSAAIPSLQQPRYACIQICTINFQLRLLYSHRAERTLCPHCSLLGRARIPFHRQGFQPISMLLWKAQIKLSNNSLLLFSLYTHRSLTASGLTAHRNMRCSEVPHASLSGPASFAPKTATVTGNGSLPASPTAALITPGATSHTSASTLHTPPSATLTASHTFIPPRPPMR
jgi:hypothetical protein